MANKNTWSEIEYGNIKTSKNAGSLGWPLFILLSWPRSFSILIKIERLNMMYDIVALGELLIDFTLVSIKYSNKFYYEQNPGGAPSNVLVMASKLGGKTALIGKVGNDHFGKYLIDVLKQNDINTSGMKISQLYNTTLSFVHLDENNERSFCFYRNPGADTSLEVNEVDFNIINNCNILHFGSLSFTSEPSRSAVLNAVKYAKKKKKIISYDPNYRPALWLNKNEAAAGLNLGVEFADIIKLSEEEAFFLSGKSGIEESARFFFEKGIKLVLITLGAKGTYFLHESGGGHVSAFEADVVDSTGAGDAFCGAVLYQISQASRKITDLSWKEIKDIVRYANAAGALCVCRTGAIPAMPTIDEIELLVEKDGSL